MPTGSCKRYSYLPFIGGTEVSCNHTKPQNDVVRQARKWYDITPLSSVTLFHRLQENTSQIFDLQGRPIVQQMGRLNYRDPFTANWFTLESYYRGLPFSMRFILRLSVYILIVVALWKVLIRPIIGPRGVLVHTESLPDDHLHQSILKAFLKLVNKLKNPRRVASVTIPE